MSTFVDFRHVKTSAGFEPVLAHYGIRMDGAGRQKTILCPFHEEKKPSCKINLDKKLFHCFGCGAKGNVLDFVAQKEGADLRSAALLLCDWCGVNPAPEKQREQIKATKAAKPQKLTAAATSARSATPTPKARELAKREEPRPGVKKRRPSSFGLSRFRFNSTLRTRICGSEG